MLDLKELEKELDDRLAKETKESFNEFLNKQRKMNFELSQILGLKVVSIKGFKEEENIKPSYIFFDDEETFITLEEQNTYDYHDCSSSAREIIINKNKEEYKNMIEWNKLFDTNTDL